MSDDLIATARRLARANPRRPRHADLRRAVSTAYFALFHTLARQCADLFVGVGAARSEAAWVHVYLALAHGFAKNACIQVGKMRFPQDILNFADSFVSLQEERHRADYYPRARYSRAETLILISNAAQAIARLKKAPRPDKRAFAALVLLKRR